MHGKKPHIVVVGSSNTDMVVRAAHLPAPGETVLGGVFAMVPGGKGANQAVAAVGSGRMSPLLLVLAPIFLAIVPYVASRRKALRPSLCFVI